MDGELRIDTDDELTRKLCEEYWERGSDGSFVHSVAAIGKPRGLSARQVTSSVSKACAWLDAKTPCIGCGAPRPVVSRARLPIRQYQRNVYQCDGCLEAERTARKLEVDRRSRDRSAILTEIVERHIGREIVADELTLRSAVSLCAFARAGASEDFQWIAPVENFQRNFTPTHDLDLELVRELYAERLIVIHPGTRETSVILEDGELSRYYPLAVHWKIAASEPSAAATIAELEKVIRSNDWPEDWYEDIDALHREVALHECLDFLARCMREHDFDFKAGPKTHMVLKQALESFSIAQVWNFAWRSARDAAAYMVRAHVSSRQAANIVPGSIQRLSERAQAEGWDVKQFKRNFKSPQSHLSEVLFNVALKTGDGYLATPPPAESDDPSVDEDVFPPDDDDPF